MDDRDLAAAFLMARWLFLDLSKIYLILAICIPLGAIFHSQVVKFWIFANR